MARTSLELNATVTGVQSIQQLSSALNESKERMKEFANMSEYDKLTQEAANFRNLQNEIAKYNQTMAQSAQGGSYTANAFNAYRNSGYGGQNPLYANATTANASKSLEQRISDLNKTIDDLTDELDDIIEKKDYCGANNVSATINQLESEKKRLEIEKQRQDSEGNKKDNALAKFFSFNQFAKALSGVGDFAQAGYTYRTDIANGNYIGAERRMGTSIASTVGNVATSIGGGLMLIPGMQLAGGIVAGLGLATNFISRLVEGEGNAADSEAAAYMGNFDAKYGASRVFGNMGKNRKENATFANDLYTSASAMAKDTGLSTNDFLQIMTQAASYGVNSDVASQMARQAGLWTQETGADTNALMKLQGTAERYGLGVDSVSTAYGGLRASGMQKGQFNEFLQGLQTVIEDGISNGYITSTEDVTRNLTMFARLSDNNPLWQGQNGVRMFSQMNNNLAQATSLSDTNSALVFSALHKGGSYVDTMEAIEKGLNDKDVFGKIFSTFMQSEGGNYEGVIERLRATYGLNYTQAKQVFAMGNKLGSAGYTQADFERDIKANGITPNAETEQTFWKNYENDIQLSLNKIGKGSWERNLEELKNTVNKYMNKTGDEKLPKDVAETVTNYANSLGYDKETTQELAKYTEKRLEENFWTDGYIGADMAVEMANANGKLENAVQAILMNPAVIGSNSIKNYLYKTGKKGLLGQEKKDYLEMSDLYDNLTSERGNNTLDDWIVKAMASNPGAAKDGVITGEEVAKMMVSLLENGDFMKVYNNTNTNSTNWETIISNAFKKALDGTQFSYTE